MQTALLQWSVRPSVAGIVNCRYIVFEDRWSQWLSRHPAVSKYLDPVFIMVQPDAQQAVPGLHNILQTMHRLPSGNVPQSVPAAAPAEAAAAVLPNMYSVANMAEAVTVGVALRTHYADPAGGLAGAGPAMHITSFVTQGQLSFW